MAKAAVAIVLAGLVLAAAGSTSASAMKVVPLSKNVLSALSGDVMDADWDGVGAIVGAICIAARAGAAAGGGFAAGEVRLRVSGEGSSLRERLSA